MLVLSVPCWLPIEYSGVGVLVVVVGLTQTRVSTVHGTEGLSWLTVTALSSVYVELRQRPAELHSLLLPVEKNTVT